MGRTLGTGEKLLPLQAIQLPFSLFAQSRVIAQLKSAVQIIDGLIIITLLGMGEPPLIVGSGVSGVQLKRLGQVSDGFLPVALAPVGKAPLGVGSGPV